MRWNHVLASRLSLFPEDWHRQSVRRNVMVRGTLHGTVIGPCERGVLYSMWVGGCCCFRRELSVVCPSTPFCSLSFLLFLLHVFLLFFLFFLFFCFSVLLTQKVKLARLTDPVIDLPHPHLCCCLIAQHPSHPPPDFTFKLNI